jgi:abequosyltransferase
MILKMLITIAIPSFNRPETLIRLLNSIDFVNPLIEIVICEDNSPKQKDIRHHINAYKACSPLNINYFENIINFGYDENIWELVRKSHGKYIMFMGDDDVFIPGSLERFFYFVREHPTLGYVLKSHSIHHANGKTEPFNYYRKTTFFAPGANTIAELFRKSVLISGFFIKREPLIKYYSNELNGTLLTQLFFLALQCNKLPSAYYDIPLTMQFEEKNVPFFGSSENEKELYEPGEITLNNSINFLKSYFKVLEYIENTLSIEVKSHVINDMSKFFYPSLSIQLHRGRKSFFQYYLKLNKLGFGNSLYFHLYFLALFFFGKKFCDHLIILIKNHIKSTPRL